MGIGSGFNARAFRSLAITRLRSFSVVVTGVKDVALRGPRNVADRFGTERRIEEVWGEQCSYAVLLRVETVFMSAFVRGWTQTAILRRCYFAPVCLSYAAFE